MEPQKHEILANMKILVSRRSILSNFPKLFSRLLVFLSYRFYNFCRCHSLTVCFAIAHSMSKLVLVKLPILPNKMIYLHPEPIWFFEHLALEISGGRVTQNFSVYVLQFRSLISVVCSSFTGVHLVQGL